MWNFKNYLDKPTNLLRFIPQKVSSELISYGFMENTF